MKTSVQDQAVFAALALMLGFALGFVFDALRAPRAHCRALGRWMLDVVFALIVFTGIFLLGLRSGAGRAGLDSLLFAALGAALYGLTLSRFVLPVFQWVLDKLAKLSAFLLWPVRKCEKKFKKHRENAKKDFPKSESCFRIQCNHLKKLQNRSSDDGRTNTNETQTGRHHYEGSSSGDCSVRGGPARDGPQ